MGFLVLFSTVGYKITPTQLHCILQEMDDEAGERKVTTSTEEERIELELKTKINARKLRFIYNFVTQENRGQ